MPVEATSREPPTQRQLLEDVERMLRSALPSGWGADLTKRPKADAVLTLKSPDGRTTSVIVEAKNTLDTRDVPRAAEQLRSIADPALSGALVVARYLSPRTREALVGSGLSYLDAT